MLYFTVNLGSYKAFSNGHLTMFVSSSKVPAFIKEILRLLNISMFCITALCLLLLHFTVDAPFKSSL